MSDAASMVSNSEVPIWHLFVAHVLPVFSAGETLHRRDIVRRH